MFWDFSAGDPPWDVSLWQRDFPLQHTHESVIHITGLLQALEILLQIQIWQLYEKSQMNIDVFKTNLEIL